MRKAFYRKKGKLQHSTVRMRKAFYRKKGKLQHSIVRMRKAFYRKKGKLQHSTVRMRKAFYRKKGKNIVKLMPIKIYVLLKRHFILVIKIHFVTQM